MDDSHVERTISELVPMKYVDDEGVGVGFDTTFRFDPDDPCAMTIVFHIDDVPVVWTFGRDLLIDGTHTPTGDGDVHVFPCLGADGTAVVMFDLESEDGAVLVQCSSRDADLFIRKMLELVPLDAEGPAISVAMALFLTTTLDPSHQPEH